MKTAREFFERLISDEEFAKSVNDSVQKLRAEGAQNFLETIIPIAEENGYAISEDELNAINQQMLTELSEEELGKVAGGASCMTQSGIFPTTLTDIIASLFGF